jgi:hypothetical protein
LRTSIEVADIFRAAADSYRAAQAGHLSLAQLKVMSAIRNCRTAALGGHVDACEDCGHWRIAYNSCLMGRIRNGELAFSGPDNLANSRRFRRHQGCALLSITGVSRDRCYRRLL